MLCGGGTLLEKGRLPHAPTPQNFYCGLVWHESMLLLKWGQKQRLQGIMRSLRGLANHERLFVRQIFLAQQGGEDAALGDAFAAHGSERERQAQPALANTLRQKALIGA